MAVITAPAALGMLGGGQLGRFFVQAAHELGYSVWVLDPDPDSPAGRIADRHLAAPWDDTAALDALADGCAAVTTEFENVPAASLERLAARIPVRPHAAAVAVCQDRRREKSFLAANGLPVGPWRAVDRPEDLADADPALFPGLLKLARLGYDGKGQARVTSADAARAALARFGNRPCVLEALLPLDREFSLVLARDPAGQVRCFPPVENAHRNGILDVSIVPARIPETLAAQAQTCAGQIAAALDYIGVLGVEFFVSDGQLTVNELAPRPHNSGHFTLDACTTSQFEQQVRALCGLPLGETRAHSAAVMVNLLGDLWGTGSSPVEPHWAELLATPGLKLHLYGKRTPRPGRKMGHFTVLAPDPAVALERALGVRPSPPGVGL